MAIPMPAMLALMQNPAALATMMASTGQQPPAIPTNPSGNRVTGVPAMGTTPTAVASGQTNGLPAPAGAPDNTALKAMLATQALSGVQAPAMAPPMNPGGGGGGGAPLPSTGFKPGAMDLMQLLMSSQQRPTTPPSLGQAILGR